MSVGTVGVGAAKMRWSVLMVAELQADGGVGAGADPGDTHPGRLDAPDHELQLRVGDDRLPQAGPTLVGAEDALVDVVAERERDLGRAVEPHRLLDLLVRDRRDAPDL